MVVWSLLLSALVFALVTIGTPGAANLLAATSGAQVGLRASSGLLVGIAVAVLSIVAVVALGVGSIVAAHPVVSASFKAVGSAYLLWLASRIARAPRPSLGEGNSVGGWRTGLALTVVNPQTWTVALSAAAGYSALSASPVVLALLLVGVFAVVVVPDLIVWCVAGMMMTRALQTDTHWRRLFRVLALLLVLSIIPMWIE